MGSIVGVDGGVDAVRRSLYQSMRSDQLPDLVLPLTVVEQGYRVVFVPGAVVEENTLTTQSAEYQMRVRVALRAFWALNDKRALLNPLRYPLFSWQLASHKLLRYMSFLPLGAAAVLNLFVVLPWLGLRHAGRCPVLCLAACLSGDARPRGPAPIWTGALLLLFPAAQLGVSGRVRAFRTR